MKIRDIITEDVDMSWWDDLDRQFNADASEYKDKQKKRHDIVHKNTDGTPVFKKPVRKSQELFTNIPKADQTKSPGYVGNVDVRVRAGHMSKNDGESLVDQSD